MAGKKQKPRGTLQGHRKVPGLIALPSRSQEKRWTRAELEDMTRGQLRELAGNTGLSKSGLKTGLVERLLAKGASVFGAQVTLRNSLKIRHLARYPQISNAMYHQWSLDLPNNEHKSRQCIPR